MAGRVLLRPKFTMPRPRACLIARPRLSAQLEYAAGGDVTLIAAPAGFGKTTLVTEWAAGQQAPVAWLSLDETDNDPHRFWRYVAAALRAVASGVGREFIAALEAGGQPDWEELISLLINDIAALATRLTLVLDDYHLIHANTIHSQLTFLLQHQPSPLHVILLSRADPPLALARLRVQGRLWELRAADLRFLPAETEDYFTCLLPYTLSQAELKILSERIEGWPAGLQLAGLSLQALAETDARDFVRAFSGAERYVFDYLLEEVLQRQPPRIQTFLLQTSVLRALNPELCLALTGYRDSRQILEHLAAENLFIIRLDGDGEWFRYHRLFAGALLNQLRQTEPDLVPELRRRASDWFAEKGSMEGVPGYLLPVMVPSPQPSETDAESLLLDPLTGRELQILALIAQGLSNQQIAQQLVISVGTVKGHVTHILSKLNAPSRTAALAKARRLGLIKS